MAAPESSRLILETYLAKLPRLLTLKLILPAIISNYNLLVRV